MTNSMNGERYAKGPDELANKLRELLGDEEIVLTELTIEHNRYHNETFTLRGAVLRRLVKTKNPHNGVQETTYEEVGAAELPDRRKALPVKLGQ